MCHITHISIIGASYNNSIYFKLNITLNEFEISSKGILNNRGYSICCDIIIIITVKIPLFSSFLISENDLGYDCVVENPVGFSCNEIKPKFMILF